MTEYDEAMGELDRAIYRAIAAADNHEGAPVDALRYMAEDIDHLISYGVTADEFRKHKRLYEGAKLAGLTE